MVASLHTKIFPRVLSLSYTDQTSQAAPTTSNPIPQYLSYPNSCPTYTSLGPTPTTLSKEPP